jgi:hypothetical protein
MMSTFIAVLICLAFLALVCFVDNTLFDLRRYELLASYRSIYRSNKGSPLYGRTPGEFMREVRAAFEQRKQGR